MPVPHRAINRRLQDVTVYVAPDVSRRLDVPHLSPGVPLVFADLHDEPSARTGQLVLQPWAATTAMEVASFGASTQPAGSGRYLRAYCWQLPSLLYDVQVRWQPPSASGCWVLPVEGPSTSASSRVLQK